MSASRKRTSRLPTLNSHGLLPGHTPATIDARLAPDQVVPEASEAYQRALDRASTLESAAWSAETQRAYQSDWVQFERYCAWHGLEALPAAPDTVRAFVAHQFDVEKKKPSTIRRRIIAIRMVHKAFGERWPKSLKKSLKKMLQGIYRENEAPVKKRTAAVDDDIKQMVDCCEEGTNRGMRDRALLLFGYASAVRRSELARVDVAHLKDTPKGYLLTVPKSKTDPEAKGQTVAVRAREGSKYCPVQAVKDWLVVSGIESGPVFPRMYRFDKIARKGEPISDRTVANLVKEYAHKAGLKSENYAGHSLRRGFLTSAAESGDDLRRLAAHSRHKNLGMVQEYIDEADKFRSPAGESLLRDDAK